MGVGSTKVDINLVREKEKYRYSNIELYRIITMLAIIAHHYVVNSGLVDPSGPIFSNPLSVPSLFLLIFGAWGKIGINCFVLITGYFMCRSNITARKFIKLLFEVMFYHIVIQAVFWGIGYSSVTISTVIEAFVPITSVTQNFTGTYLLFFLCIPFLNIMIGNLKEKQHVYLILLSCFIYVFFGTVKLFPVTMNYVSWYIVLYFIASYIRLYPKKIFGNFVFWKWMLTICLILSAGSVIACTWIGVAINRNMSYVFVTDSNTFLAVLTAISSFMLFKNIELRYNKVINTIASTTFGVLLLHTNSVVRQWLWKDVLDNVGFYHSQWIWLHAIGSVFMVFAICSFIDLARIRLVERPFLILWDRRWDKISKRYKKFEKKICEKWHISIN